MFSKAFKAEQPHDVVFVAGVLAIQMIQYFQLDARLVLELAFVAEDLDSHEALLLVVEALEGLAERATPQVVNDFVPKPYVAAKSHHVKTFIVVKAVIVQRAALYIHLSFTAAQVVNRGVVEDFGTLVVLELTRQLRL